VPASHVTEFVGHDAEIGGHASETGGHDGPKYATTASMTRPTSAGFVDLGALRTSSNGGADRLEITLDLGGGITLHVVRG
jgi:hypothetical protein